MNIKGLKMSKQVEINDQLYNTYATVEDADNYFAASYGSEWANIGAVQKPQLLVSATRLIDRRDYQGIKVDENQPLKFPRLISGIQTDDYLLMMTCCELALNIYSDGGKDVDISNIKSVSLGDSSVSFRDTSKTESEEDLLIEDFLSDYLMGGVRVIL